MPAPVVMFVYNRADHFKKTYEALAQCPEAIRTNLYIFADGAKSDSTKKAVSQVRAELKKVADDDRFNSISIIENTKNKGLARSVTDGVTEVINEHGKAIVLEDDCMPCRYFLNYMNLCLDYYETEKSIGAVTAYVPMIKLPDDYDKNIFLAKRSCSWSWGTWKDRWDGVTWNADKIFKDICNNKKWVRDLSLNGSDRFMRLYRQTKGNAQSWSILFGANIVMNEQWVVYPRHSYIRNIGCDESGVHSGVDDAEIMKVNLDNAVANPQMCELQPDSRIQKIMNKHYSNGFVSDLRRMIAAQLIRLRYK